MPQGTSKNKTPHLRNAGDDDLRLGVESGHMWREETESRLNWQERCEEVGFRFHSAPGVQWGWRPDPYWTEDGSTASRLTDLSS